MVRFSLTLRPADGRATVSSQEFPSSPLSDPSPLESRALWVVPTASSEFDFLQLARDGVTPVTRSEEPLTDSVVARWADRGGHPL